MTYSKHITLPKMSVGVFVILAPCFLSRPRLRIGALHDFRMARKQQRWRKYSISTDLCKNNDGYNISR